MKALLEGAIGDNDEDSYDREEGSIDSLSVRLLPHQLDGLAWMLEKELGKKKKNGALPLGGILADDVQNFPFYLFFSILYHEYCGYANFVEWYRWV